MHKFISKSNLLYRTLEKIKCCNFLSRRFSDSDDKSKSSAYKGERLPGIYDAKNLWKVLSYEYEEDLDSLIPRETDILIIGGGIIGWSAAYFIRHNAMMNVTVIERDPSHTRSASVLGIGAIRQQFSEPENIQMSLYGADFIRNVREHLSILDVDPPDIQFHPHGFLTLSSIKGFEELKKCYEVQRLLGCKVELLTANDIKAIWPWMETDDLGGGIHGYENEGWFDPWQLLNALQRKASSLGVQKVIGEIVGFEFQEGVVSPGLQDIEKLGKTEHKPKNALVRLHSGNIQPIHFAFAINAGGPWAGDVAKLVGMGDINSHGGLLALPVEPRVQHAFVVSPARSDNPGNVPGIDCPFIVDYNGLNVRRDRLGGDFIVFTDTPPLSKHYQRPPKVDDKMVGESGLIVNFEQFETRIRPLLQKRIPSMGTGKVRSGWASYLDYNYVDQNLIIGNHPIISNFLFANGSSGHGIEHSMAIGRALFELIIFGHYKSIELKNFGFHRFYENTLVFEKEIF